MDVRIESCDTVMRIDNCDYASFFGFSNVTTGSPVRIEKTGGECRYLNVQTYPLAPVNYQSIRPGEVWLDTEGKPIQAHGFQVTFREGKYYWYGEDKTHTLFGTNRMFGGVRCTHLPIFTIGKMKEGSLNLLLIHIHLCIIVRNWNARIFFIVPKQAGMYVG